MVASNPCGPRNNAIRLRAAALKCKFGQPNTGSGGLGYILNLARVYAPASHQFRVIQFLLLVNPSSNSWSKGSKTLVIYIWNTSIRICRFTFVIPDPRTKSLVVRSQVKKVKDFYFFLLNMYQWVSSAIPSGAFLLCIKLVITASCDSPFKILGHLRSLPALPFIQYSCICLFGTKIMWRKERCTVQYTGRLLDVPKVENHSSQWSTKCYNQQIHVWPLNFYLSRWSRDCLRRYPRIFCRLRQNPSSTTLYSTQEHSSQGVTKRCRLSWMTNSDLVYEPECGGEVSANEYSCTYGAQINFGARNSIFNTYDSRWQMNGDNVCTVHKGGVNKIWYIFGNKPGVLTWEWRPGVGW